MNQPILDENYEQRFTKVLEENIPRINTLIISVNEKIGQIKVARGALVFLGIASLFSSLFVHYYSSIHYLHIQLNWKTFFAIFIPMLYFSCAIGVSINQMLSISIGLLTFLILHIIYSYDIFQVIMLGLMKFPIIYFLGTGLIAAYKLEKDIYKLGILGVPKKERNSAYALKKMDIL